MGWNIVYQFRKAQNEINRYPKLIPLITPVDNVRVRESLEVIDGDQREYTLNVDDQKVQTLIFPHEQSKKGALVLKKPLSCSYPNLCFNEALKKENEKLQLELQRSQANLDMGQCEVIERLIDVSETAAVTSLPEKGSQLKSSKKTEKKFSNAEGVTNHSFRESDPKKNDAHRISSYTFVACEAMSGIPIYSTVAQNLYLLIPVVHFRRLLWLMEAPAEACNDLMVYSLILSCCCYTCCVRRKLCKMSSIKGGWFDDFLWHLMCCCCCSTV